MTINQLVSGTCNCRRVFWRTCGLVTRGVSPSYRLAFESPPDYGRPCSARRWHLRVRTTTRCNKNKRMENPERRNIVNTKKERKTLEWLEGTKFHSLGERTKTVEVLLFVGRHNLVNVQVFPPVLSFKYGEPMVQSYSRCIRLVVFTDVNLSL